MNEPSDEAARQDWADAQLAAALFAVAPSLVGGIVVRASPGPVRDTFLESVRELLPAERPFRRIPLHINDARLLGGMDLAATLSAGKPIVEQGLLSQCDGGVALLSMAERVTPMTAALLGAVLDTGEVIMQRDGLQDRAPADIGVIALDEGLTADEGLPPGLMDRLALLVNLHQVGIRDLQWESVSASAVAAARERLPGVVCPEAAQRALCSAAVALGVDSVRSSLLAVRTARVATALGGADEVDESALDAAVRLVLAPRATRLPATDTDAETEQEEPSSEDTSSSEPEGEEAELDRDREESTESAQQGLLEDRLLEAARAAIPPDLLARLRSGQTPRRPGSSQGKSGARQRRGLRGRPMGTVAGDPGGGARLNLVATLRAAAPWQPLRRIQARAAGRPAAQVQVSRDDLRITRYRQRAQSTTIFVVDASGSAALHRLAEAKGAIELLLAECYVRRDEVALIAFRGGGAEVLLPPTRSLVRAKRSLAALPGGGGTPLASAIDLTAALAEQVRRRGGTPCYVLLTDGRANIARDGSGGRVAAGEEAQAAASVLRIMGVHGMVIDTSPRPHESAELLARNLDARYLPLPHADAAVLRDAVQAAGN